jgi:choline-glycine betaine transporter
MGTGAAEASASAARELLLPVCALSGAAVLAGFFFPEFVGEAVSGGGWLTVALLFFASGLGYGAGLPYASDREPVTAAAYLLRVRRTGAGELVRGVLGGLSPGVVLPPAAVFAAYFLARVVAPGTTGGIVDAVSRTLLQEAGGLFLGVTLLAVGYCLFLLLGPWGDVRLGGPEAEPSYTYPTYFTLVFTAGIAAGVVFWGPAEALFHYQGGTPYFGGEPRTGAAVGEALTYTLFHWGISAWSAYAVLGVPIAYFVFQRGAPLRVSAILTPVLGPDGLDSVPGRAVDALAVFATVGGIATSVALVSEQFLAGIAYHWVLDVGAAGPVLFVGGLTLIFVVSAATGIHRGIRRLAGLNVALFGLFGLALVAVGPREFVVRQGSQALGRYAAEFLQLSLYTGGTWVTEWTVWNWSWWFSWAPFAGLFLAALSRGRRIRTVVLTGVVATAAATAVWFLLVGGTALWVQRTGLADPLGAVTALGGSEAVAGFPVLAALPLGELLVFLFLALIVLFIVTSADTSTLVAAVLASRHGVAPSTGGIVLLGSFQGVVAAAVLVLGGAETLQALTVLTGGPFAVLAVVAMAGLALACYRHERGGDNRSVLAHVGARLPDVQTHHDVEPPEPPDSTDRDS